MSFELDNYTRPHILIHLGSKQEDLIQYLLSCNFEILEAPHKDIYKAILSKAYDFCIFSSGPDNNNEGLDLISAVRKGTNKVPIIYISNKYDFTELAKVYSLGVDDYMVWPINYEELAYRIRAIIKRTGIKLITPENTYNIGRFVFDIPAGTLIDSKDELGDIKLSPKAAQILALLCMYNGEIVPRELLLARLWKDSSYYTQRCLDVYIASLRKYLKPDPAIKIETYIRIGFSLIIK